MRNFINRKNQISTRRSLSAAVEQFNMRYLISIFFILHAPYSRKSIYAYEHPVDDRKNVSLFFHIRFARCQFNISYKYYYNFPQFISLFHHRSFLRLYLKTNNINEISRFTLFDISLYMFHAYW